VKAGLIPEKQDDFVLIAVLKGEGFKSQFGELAVYGGKKQPVCFSSGWIYKSLDVDPLVLNPVHSPWF
jgi:hypothetical protein